MDSLTQAVLGAACGEAVLGKKMGNKALMWGAIAGTIPDLDVVMQFFLSNEVYELIYHRGLSHSILFTIVGAPILGWLACKHRSWLSMGFWALLMLFIGGNTLKGPSAIGIGISVAMLALGGWLTWKLFFKEKPALTQAQLDKEPTHAQWSWMFFWAILTHWFIDACTSYGTQIFEPFSSYRVSFNNIAIIDPLYTLPLLLSLIILLFIKKTKTRQIINWIGIGLSSAYMIFSFYAKSLANQAFKESLKAQGIEYNEFISYPSIFTTLLWQTTVKSDSAYYFAAYSLMDKDKNIEFIKLPINHHLLDKYEDEDYVRVLKWFAQGYYNVTEGEDGLLHFHNLRFGLMGFGVVEFDNPYIFSFRIGERNGKFDTWIDREEDLKQVDMGQALSVFWRRTWGDKTKEKPKK